LASSLQKPSLRERTAAEAIHSDTATCWIAWSASFLATTAMAVAHPGMTGELFMPPITSALIVAEARSWISTPYRHQASLKGVGCDCLGLLRGVWRELFGTEPELVPPYAPDWAEASGAETLAEAARRHLVEIAITDIAPGDIALFRWRASLPAKHAAIVTAPDRFVHAHDGAAVAETALAAWWRRRLTYAFRFPGVG
jgi:NlpC/P60 family putative phage cell wall peptidase